MCKQPNAAEPIEQHVQWYRQARTKATTTMRNKKRAHEQKIL